MDTVNSFSINKWNNEVFNHTSVIRVDFMDVIVGGVHWSKKRVHAVELHIYKDKIKEITRTKLR
jgi:hypothetical protein